MSCWVQSWRFQQGWSRLLCSEKCCSFLKLKKSSSNSRDKKIWRFWSLKNCSQEFVLQTFAAGCWEGVQTAKQLLQLWRSSKKFEIASGSCSLKVEVYSWGFEDGLLQRSCCREVEDPADLTVSLEECSWVKDRVRGFSVHGGVSLDGPNYSKEDLNLLKL